MPRVHLTKRAIDALPLTKAGQQLYRDDELTGFGIRIGSTSKVFFVEGQVARRTVRVTIGKYGPLSPEVARKLALKHLSEMAHGRDPNAEKKVALSQSVTVRGAFERLFAAKRDLAASTVLNYSRTVDVYLGDWTCRPLNQITRQMILSRHRQISDSHGAITANGAMRHLRSVYNFIAASHEGFPPNPVVILSQARAWAPERRRRGLIPSHALPQWWAAVMQEPSMSRDILLMAIFTGLRRREITALRWDCVDLRGRTLNVPKTKNGDPLSLPLSAFLMRLLLERKLTVGGSPFLFPTRSASGHVEEVKSFTARVGSRSGCMFSMHDLRRTFITIAESLDIPAYALRRLLNHRASADVTGGYIIIEAERLRVPVDRISSRILELSNADGDTASAAAA